jgi:thioredoxin reductase
MTEGRLSTDVVIVGGGWAAHEAGFGAGFIGKANRLEAGAR